MTAPVPPRPNALATGRRILVAEDDALIRDVLCTRLRFAGYDVHTARSGPEALERVVLLRPDLLLLDLGLPELDGFGVLETLRTEFGQTGLPVLVLTARQGSEDVERAVKLGARDYVVKNAGDDRLLLRIERLLRGRGAGRTAAA